MRKIMLLSAAIAAVAIPAQAQQLPLSGWQIRYSPGMPTKPTVVPGGWQFTFPSMGAGTCPAPDTKPPNYNISNCHHVDYVTVPYTKAITAKTIVMTFEVHAIAGTIFSHYTQTENTPDGPSAVRFMIEERNDSQLNNPTGRWWSNPIAFNLADTGGVATLSAPIDPSQWSDVNGQTGTQNQSGWSAALRTVGNVGMTFGGGYFFGHGVGTSAGGPATFVMHSLQLE